MIFRKIEEKYPSFYQFAKFLILGLVASVVEFIVFGLCNYLIFKPLSGKPFTWFIFTYTPANGGLCAFLSMAFSYAAAQITNFIIQRKYTFKATNNPALSAVLFAIMVIGTYIFVMWLPSVIGEPVYKALGAEIGAIVVKMICQTASALIQFPLNKFVVMRA
ncbi:MAG: hypothetical protein K5634_01680 [Sphaerochaetaceae bacterium]|nr:hypothetical protein [Sphaerochaetaceae bacterium]